MVGSQIEDNCGFRPIKSIHECIFTLCQISETIAYIKKIDIFFPYLAKAFDHVSRHEL